MLSRGGRYCGDFPVARIAMPSVDAFERDYASVGRPVIVTGWLAKTGAGRKWSPEYLVRSVGEREVVLTRLRRGKLRSDNDRYRVRFAEYAAAAFAGDAAAREFCVQQIELPDSIARDLPAPPIVGSWLRQPPGFWLSTPGHVTETHRDENHNLLVQVLGRKRITLFSPIFTEALYSHRAGGRLARYSRVDLERPDFRRFPSARELTPTQVVLEPGEALFLPVYWWHRVETLEPSVSVNFWWAPPLRLLLYPRWATRSGSPASIFAAVHALADLSPFASELDVVEHLRSEGFEEMAAAYFRHCLSILAASGRGAPRAERLRSVRSIARRCGRARDLGALVAEARRLATRLGCARRLRPSRWLAPAAHQETAS